MRVCVLIVYPVYVYIRTLFFIFHECLNVTRTDCPVMYLFYADLTVIL